VLQRQASDLITVGGKQRIAANNFPSWRASATSTKIGCIPS